MLLEHVKYSKIFEEIILEWKPILLRFFNIIISLFQKHRQVMEKIQMNLKWILQKESSQSEKTNCPMIPIIRHSEKDKKREKRRVE